MTYFRKGHPDASGAGDFFRMFAFCSRTECMPMTLRISLLGLLTIASCVLPLVSGCQNSFSPKSDYDPRLVIYAVLDRGKTTQMVRIESTYDAEITNPDQPKEKRPIEKATVYVEYDRIRYYFRDTLLTVTDMVNGVPVSVSKKVWINSDLPILPAQSYQLSVAVEGYPSVDAITLTPNRPYVTMLVRSFESGARNLEIAATTSATSPQTKGYYYQLWVTAKRVVDGNVVQLRFPVRYSVDPALQSEKDRVARAEKTEFAVEMVQQAYQNLLPYQDAYDIQVVAKVWTMDVNMYNYFKTVRGFDDPVSVRQDRPDVTNLRNGFGIFGGICTDSVSISYITLIGN